MRRRKFFLLAAGTAMTWPLAARAQQKAMPVIGFLGATSPGALGPYLASFRQGLSEAGFVEGQNVTIEYRWAENHNERLPAMAAELVERKVDLIVTLSSGPVALAAKGATSTIPIVFGVGVDPVAQGLVGSLARPGGNLTGATVFGALLTPKRLQLLCELLPQVRVIGFLVNPTNLAFSSGAENLQAVARAKGVQLQIVKAGTENEIDAAFTSLVQGQAGGLLVGADPLFFRRREQIAALAVRYGIPAIYSVRDFAASGGLMSYGPSFTAEYRLVGIYAGRVLKGEKPADLPVQQPITFELVINLKTVKALGITVPQSLLARADEMIE